MLHPGIARFILLGVFTVLVALVWLVPTTSSGQCACLTVSFLNVGQGDAIYLKTFDGVEVLVDGGASASVLSELAKVRPFFDRDLDVIVATHPDLDHIGGLIDVLHRFSVELIVTTTNKNDTPAATTFAAAVAAENAAVIYPEAGQRFLLGASTTLTIFSPQGDETDWESNSASVVMKISYGETDVLLTGDAYATTEQYLVEQFGSSLQSEILKLGHHGSRTSTSEVFLDTVKPAYTIVSAGVDNRYNHPHDEVIARVEERAIPTFHTGVDGTVTFRSDGSTFTKK